MTPLMLPLFQLVLDHSILNKANPGAILKKLCREAWYVERDRVRRKILHSSPQALCVFPHCSIFRRFEG